MPRKYETFRDMDNRFLFIFCVGLGAATGFSFPTQGRSSSDPLAVYKAAQAHYAAKRYAEAEADFRALMATGLGELYDPYVLFYYALSAYHCGHKVLSEDVFKHLLFKFPSWDQTPEVCYWLAHLRFEAQDYEGGLKYLERIKQKSFVEVISRLKRHFLNKIKSISQLQTLVDAYNDPIAAQILALRLANGAIEGPEAVRGELSAKQLGIDVAQYEVRKYLPTIKKDHYNVAVLLPFLVANSPTLQDSSLLDMYRGMRMAIDTLEKTRISIRLFAYDTGQDIAKTAELLAYNELKGMDLIIGPLSKDAVALAAQFSQQHRINVFNPLSIEGDVLQQSPFIFMGRPSHETQARQAARFISIQPGEKRIGIVYSIVPEDEVRALTFKQSLLEQERNKVILLLQVTPDKLKNFLHRSAEGETTSTLSAALAGLTHLYVASEDKLLVGNVLSALAMRNLQPQLIGYERWLEYSMVSWNQLRQLKALLIAPDFIDYKKPSLNIFRASFYDKFAQLPSLYAYLGYDSMLFLGHMLHRHGVYFQKEWGEEEWKGTTLAGFLYGSGRDNQWVPLITLTPNGIVACNEPVAR